MAEGASPARGSARGSAGRSTRRTAAEDYRARSEHEAARFARASKKAALPAPMGDLASGVLVAVAEPAGPRLLDALARSLRAVGLPDAYVAHTSASMLGEQILAAEPLVLVALGADAAREVDALEHPLARNRFSDAHPGTWFAWTKGTTGILLPPLTPALEDEKAKRAFWHAFLALRDLRTPQP